MQYENIMSMVVAAISSLAVTRYFIMPAWFYRELSFKPFNCTTCFAFWAGLLLTIYSGGYLLAPVIGLASAGLSCLIIKITER